MGHFVGTTCSFIRVALSLVQGRHTRQLQSRDTAGAKIADRASKLFEQSGAKIAHSGCRAGLQSRDTAGAKIADRASKLFEQSGAKIAHR